MAQAPPVLIGISQAGPNASEAFRQEAPDVAGLEDGARLKRGAPRDLLRIHNYCNDLRDQVMKDLSRDSPGSLGYTARDQPKFMLPRNPKSAPGPDSKGSSSPRARSGGEPVERPAPPPVPPANPSSGSSSSLSGLLSPRYQRPAQSVSSAAASNQDGSKTARAATMTYREIIAASLKDTPLSPDVDNSGNGSGDSALPPLHGSAARPKAWTFADGRPSPIHNAGGRTSPGSQAYPRGGGNAWANGASPTAPGGKPPAAHAGALAWDSKAVAGRVDVRHELDADIAASYDISDATMMRIHRLLEFFAGGFQSVLGEILDKAPGRESRPLLVAHVWTCFVRAAQQQCKVDYGSELAHVLEDYAARLQDAGNRLADMAAQLERKDALVQLVNEQLQEAARFAREETRLRQLAEAGKFEAEKKVHRALEQAAADRLCLARAEEELEELSRLPIQLSEHSRREWELTEKFVLLQEECATVAKNRDELAEQLAMLQATKDALEAELLNAHTRTRQAEMDMELYSGNLRDREENILARTRELEVLREQACKASEMLAEVEAENLALSRRGSEFTERVEALEEQLAERDARLAEARALADTHEERMAELRATMEARIQEERDALAAVTAQLAHANTELQAAHAEADEAARVAHERRAFLLGDVGRLERKVASLEKKLAEAGDALAVEKERVAATRAERDALAAEAKEEAAAASKQLAHQREETARAIRGYQEREKQLADEYGQELGRAREELRRTLKHTMDELTVEKKKVEQLEKQLAAAGDHRPHREEEKPRSPPLPVDERRELEALRKRVEQLETRNAALEKRHSTAHVEELERRHVEMSMRVVEAEEALKDLRVQLATACETSARDAARASQLEELLSLVGEGKADVVQELDRERIRAQVLQITATELADELEEQAVAAQRLLTEGLAEEGAARRQVEDTLALMIVRDKEKDAAIGALQREVDRLLGILERGGEPVPDGATLRPVTAEEKVHARAAAVKALRAAVQAALAVTRFASAGERGAQAATSLPMDTSPIAEGSASELEMESSGEAAGAGAVGKQGRRWSAFVPPREGIEAAAAADGARRGSADSLFRTAAHMAAVQQRIWQVTTKARQVGGFRRARQPSVTRTMLAQAWQKGELLPEEEPHVEEDEEEWEEGEGAVAEPATTATAAAMRSNNSKGKDSGGAGAKGGVGTGARVGSGVLPAVPVLGRREHALNVLSQMLEAANFYARHGMPPPTAEEALKRAASKTRIAAVATQATGDASTLARPGRSSMAKSSAKGRADAKSSSIVRTRSEASLQGAQRASVSSGSKPAAATTRTAQPSVSSRNRSVLFADSKAAHEVDGAQEGGGGTSPSTPLWGNASTGDHPPGATPSPLLLQSSARSSRSSSSPSASAEDAQASGDTATSRTRFADSPGDEATSAAGGGNARSMDAPPGTRQPSRRQSAAEEQAIPKAPLPLVLPRVSADGGAVGSDRGQAGGGGGSEGDAVANLLGELDQNEGEDGSPGEMVMRAPSRASVGRPGAGNAGARIQGHATTRAEHSEGAGQRKPSGWGRDAAAGKGGRAGANRHGLPTMTVRVDPSSGTMRLALPEHAWQVTEDGMLTIAPFGIDLSGTGVPLEAREGGAARGGAVNTGSEEGQGGRASGVPPLESEEWTRETVARVSLPWLHRPEKGPHRIELECKMVDLNLMSPRREFETSVPAHLGHLLYRMAGVP